MFNTSSKWVFVSVLATALVAGCGGGSSAGYNTPPNPPANPAASTQGVVDYILALIASSTSDSADPVDTDAVTLATDDTAEPSPI